MYKRLAYAAIAAALMGFAMSASATIVNLDAVHNAIDDVGQLSTKAVQRSLDAGTYSVTFTEGEYTAFNRWGKVTSCDGDQSCSRGWENSAGWFIDGQSDFTRFGDLNFGGEFGGPPDSRPDGGFFKTAADSFQHARTYSAQFTLTSTTDVWFFIGDDKTDDNKGGVSLLVSRVAAVPDPSTWTLLLFGLGMIGLGVVTGRRSRSTAV